MRAKRSRWSIANPASSDFLPIVIGCLFLVLSLPGFFMVLLDADQGSEGIAGALLIILAGGIVIGTLFVILGLRICSFPGSWLYRITHGRIFSR
jgi:hypothetical protein